MCVCERERGTDRARETEGGGRRETADSFLETAQSDHRFGIWVSCVGFRVQDAGCRVHGAREVMVPILLRTNPKENDYNSQLRVRVAGFGSKIRVSSF